MSQVPILGQPRLRVPFRGGEVDFTGLPDGPRMAIGSLLAVDALGDVSMSLGDRIASAQAILRAIKIRIVRMHEDGSEDEVFLGSHEPPQPTTPEIITNVRAVTREK